MKNILSELDGLLAQPSTSPDGSFSTMDVAEHLGVSRDAALIRIRRWVRAGLVETCRTHRTAITGRVSQVFAYRPVKQRGKK